ncbi:NAD(P)/FAD-dependent oxidoreductase [Mycobacterium sp. AT1]|uniref:NAD(P)/FAD-dependent oxidoreductase n=1 Tax=Mycobacterium sp. AT1 TaxID=1961706 RepID=UPI0009C91DA3|nr:FAD-dependent oxidoreductase [Mycobacterium sp. AT1]OPX10654.1 ferredoxin reductase [Mycobacterium sp. AT1]
MTHATVIVGAGHAGANLVGLLRQERYDGDIVMLGAEPHLPYHRPPLSKKFFSDECRQPLRPLEFYAEQSVEMRLSTEVSFIDRAARKLLTIGGEAVEYETLVLATGAAPRRLVVEGSGLEGILALRTLDDAAHLRASLAATKRLAIVGGGYIGLEVAAEARRHGVAVTVIEREDRVLARVASPEFSAALAAQHAALGTEIVTSADVAAFAEGAPGRVGAVVLANGDAITCDAVLVGVGAVPRDELAQAAGIDCEGGILVDETARTSDPHVFAIGDVTRRPLTGQSGRIRLESIPSAIEQARQVAAAITGTAAPTPEVPWFWSDQFDLKLKIAGLVQPCREAILRGDPTTGKFAFFHLSSDNVVEAVETSNAPALFMAGKKMIGQRARVDPALLVDDAVDLRTCVTAH